MDTTLMAILTGAFTMLKTSLDIKSKLGKMDINVKVNEFIFEDDLLLANIQITNKTEKPINIDAVELHINDQVYRQIPILNISDEVGGGRIIKVDTHRDTYFLNGENFSHYKIFPFCPYLEHNQMAHGIMGIPVKGKIDSLKSLLIHIAVAGYNDPF